MAASISVEEELLKLPNELVDLIVQLFDTLARKDNAYVSDKATRRGVSACASTCRAWRGRFQPLLFRRLHLSSPLDVRNLAAMVHEDPAIGPYVHELLLLEDQDMYSHTLPLLLSYRLPSLTSITSKALGVARGRVSPLQHPPVLPSLSGMQTITSLTLENCRFRSFKSFSRVVSAFGRLLSLTCKGIRWDVELPIGPDGLIIPYGISPASDTLGDIHVDDCPQSHAFLLLLCVPTGWSARRSSCADQLTLSREEGSLLQGLTSVFASNLVQSVSYARRFSDTLNATMQLPSDSGKIHIRCELSEETGNESSIEGLCISVRDSTKRPHIASVTQKWLLSLFKRLRSIKAIEYENELDYLTPFEIALFHAVSSIIPTAHIVFKGLDDVTDRIYHLDNMHKFSPEYHSAADLLRFPGISGIVLPQRIFDYTTRGLVRAGEPSIVFPGGIHLHHALDPSSKHTNRPEYQAWPSAVREHTELGMKSSIRILWPGYPPWFYMFYAHDRRAKIVHHPSPLHALAYRIAGIIKKFVQRMRSYPTKGSWDVNKIQFERLVLIELRHVRRASWQPLLVYEGDVSFMSQ